LCQDEGADRSAGAGEIPSRQHAGADRSAGAGETPSRQHAGADRSAGAGETPSRQHAGADRSAGAGETPSRQHAGTDRSAGAGETSSCTDTRGARLYNSSQLRICGMSSSPMLHLSNPSCCTFWNARLSRRWLRTCPSACVTTYRTTCNVPEKMAQSNHRAF